MSGASPAARYLELLVAGRVGVPGPSPAEARASSAAPRATNSSLNFFTKLSTGHEAASPKAQMVRPWMFWAMCSR